MRGLALGLFSVLGVVIIGSMVVGVHELLDRLARDAAGSCWVDPRPEVRLDFDFYTGIDGQLSRCGYSRGTLGRAQAIAGDPREGFVDVVRCYPLARKECPK